MLTRTDGKQDHGDGKSNRTSSFARQSLSPWPIPPSVIPIDADQRFSSGVTRSMRRHTMEFRGTLTIVAALFLVVTDAWTTKMPSLPISNHHHISCTTGRAPVPSLQRRASFLLASPSTMSSGNIHGQGACFLPLKQLGSDYYAPRIVQIAGAYPGLTRDEFLSVQSEPPADQGQWTYDFSDPDGPQLGTVALDGTNLVASCQDPVVIIAEHTSIGVELPKEVVDPVDLIVLVDRSKKTFGERKFLVLHTPDRGVSIAAFPAKQDLPNNSEILGQVELVQIPWLPCMQPSKTGFMEDDEYF